MTFCFLANPSSIAAEQGCSFYWRSSILFLLLDITKSFFLFKFYDKLKDFFGKKICLTDSENHPENTNYDIKWKCNFSKYKYIFYSVSKKSNEIAKRVIAKTSTFNRGKEISCRNKTVIVGLQTSLSKTWEAFLGKTVMLWKEHSVRTALTWILPLLPNNP